MLGNANDQTANAEDRLATALRGFGPIGIAAILIILGGNFLFLPLSAILVLVWAWSSRTPWREVGYIQPKNWLSSLVVGIVFGVFLKVVMKTLVMPLLGAPPMNQAYHYLVGNSAALPGMLYLVTIGAGFGEETVYRGWMFERLGKLFGATVPAKFFIVLITSLLFGLAHYFSQGIPGTEQATIVGLVFGTIFAMTGQIFPLMIAHAAFDLAAVAMIYWNLETTFARLIFK